jgi:hypothetical protein
MATFTVEQAQKLIKHNGHYPGTGPLNSWDNPRAIKIVSYTDVGGKRACGIIFEGEPADKYDYPTEFIRDPQIIWQYKND